MPVGDGPLVVDVARPPSGRPEERRALLGGKGLALIDMTARGMPVPPGFVLTTEAFRHHRSAGWDETLEAALTGALARLEAATGKRLGDRTAPLLVSVRSGAAISMPGMMDTVLDVGMTPDVRRALAERTGDERFADDTARRAAESFVEVVGSEAPADPVEQVRAAVRAVFESWDRPRARAYREVEGIDHDLGTAVTVQAMVFGNLGDRSGTGVAFTRDPATGERRLMGDFLPGAQGEDVVAGGQATLSLDVMAERWPDEYADLAGIADRLERYHGDLVDIEFTVEDGTVWVLQTRRGTRSPIATFRIAIDMAEDPAFPLDRAGAVERCRHLFDDPPTISAEQDEGDPIAEGLAASPGRGSGVLCLDPDEAVELDAAGRSPVLARTTTSPADVHGMAVAAGLFTTRGGRVSHAAVVARDWGIPAVVGAAEATIEDGGVRGPGGFVAAGELVTVDGDRGVLLAGRAASSTEPAPEVLVVRRWAAALDRPGLRPEGDDGAPSTVAPGS